MQSAAQPSPSPARARSGVILALAVGAVGTYKAIESMASPALPIVQQELGATRAEIAWVITGVLLTGPIVTPLVGRLGDIFDKRKVLLAVLSIVGLGTLVSALSISMPMLIVGQLLQGFGLSTVPLAVGIMRETQTEQRLKTGNGIMVGTIYACTALAMLVAGPIADKLHFSWLFWFPFIVLVAMIILSWRLIPSCPPVAGASTRIDFVGAALFGAALALFLVALTYAPEWGWTSTGFLGLVGLALVLLIAFVFAELKISEPLVDVRILGSRQVIAASVLMIVAGLAINLFFVSVPMQVQQPTSTGYGLGASGTMTSFILVPGVLIGTAAPVVSWIERVAGTRIATVFGPAILIVGFLCATQSGGSVALTAVSMLCAGLGSGMAIAQAMNLVVAAVPADRVGAFSGMNFVVKAIGSTSGAQVAASILSTDAADAGQSPSWSAFTTVFVFGLAGAILALIVGLTAVSKRTSRQPAPVGAVELEPRR
ncbi:MFS transporter [Amycolatopsis sp. NPDC051903]|uniref:MFS transporter n=1 Tax=Amycolatopsis sp. NPDC051903 TaxID=3363936 RepID=UPI0037A7575C